MARSRRSGPKMGRLLPTGEVVAEEDRVMEPYREDAGVTGRDKSSSNPRRLSRKIYALRAVETGWYMPMIRSNRGYTGVELEYWKPLGKGLPRVFGSKVAANRARECWAKGVWLREWEVDDFSHGRYIVGAKPPDTPGSRKLKDVEVVELTIREGKGDV